jgi:GNAT superfamily N-acetyltransferase
MPAPEFRVRSGGESDLDFLVGQNLRLAQDSEGLTLDPAVCRQGVQAVLGNPVLGQYLVAETPTGPVGSLLLTTEWSDWRNCAYWWVQSVYVVPEWQGRGVFHALLAEVERRAKQAGSACLRLYVDRSNTRAFDVYRKCGFSHEHYQLMEKNIAPTTG